MADLFRDAPIGQIIRYLTGNRVLQYPEERPDFQCPHGYIVNEKTETTIQPTLSPVSTPSADDRQDSVDPEKAGLEPSEPIVHVTDRPNDDPQIPSADRPALERMETSHSGFSHHTGMEKTTTNPTRNPLSRTTTRETLSRAHTRADLENAFATAAAATVTRTPTTNALAPIPSHPIQPQRTAEGQILVDWYTTTDPSNPQNWSLTKKSLVSLQICLYTLAVYMGSAIYTPAIGGVIASYDVGEEKSTTGTLAIRAGLRDRTAALLAFERDPARGEESGVHGDDGDFCDLARAERGSPKFRGTDGVKVPAGVLRESVFGDGGRVVAGSVFLGEIARLMAQSEIDQANLRPKDVVFEALVRPMQLIVMDPAIGFTAGYVALCYGIYYSFFEAFPLVYIDRYGFNLGQMGLTFLSIIVGVVLSIAIYYTYLYKIVEPEIRKFGLGAPERRLLPAIPASLLMPVGLFIFGWTGSVGHVHWIVSVIGIGIFTMGVFVLMQCIFVYLPLVYPQYAASLFAGNDFARSTLAFAAVMFSRPMYIGMGVGPATSLLGGLTAACVGGILVLYLYGDKLRARSKFSAK
ncbi:hypothetical protein NU195Hw_g136t1 [Hortaea werneckii]